MVLGMHAGYLQLPPGDPRFAEHHLTGTAVGTLVVLSVNTMRFSYRLSLWSALVAMAGYLWIRSHHDRIDPLTFVDLFLFGSVCAMHVYSSRRFESILGRTMLDLRSIQEARLSSLSRLVAGIAHEMNSPLGVMKTNAQLVGRVGEIVRSTPPAEKKFERALDSLDQAQKASTSAVERMASIVESLRKFSRLDQAEVQVVDVRECLDACVEMLPAEAKSRIQIVKTFPAEPTRISCRPAHLNQAFLNVLENAVQAMEKEGTLELRIIEQISGTRIEIADTGRGIPPEKLAQIFDPTFSGTGGRTKMGFGLASCHAIIGDHGGTIRIESEIGRGTTVTITIP
jgi:signal transduction histidine kinase